MSRATELIASLALSPHPEGGYFRQIYRSASQVQPLDARSPRPALTTIYFLLTADDISRWHRVMSDEVWHYYQGAPLELWTIDAGLERPTRRLLGAIGEAQPVHVVAAGEWQAARSTGDYTLVGCTVGPGFEFDDFTMLRDVSGEAEALRQRHPELMTFLDG